MHLAHLVDVQCKRHNIQTIIDLGAGLVRKRKTFKKKDTNADSCAITIFFPGIHMPNVTLFVRLSSLGIGKR